MSVSRPASPFSGIIYNWKERGEEDSFHVTCKTTGEVWNIGDTPAVLRVKFLEMATFGIIWSVGVVFARTVRFFLGSFVDHAKLQAKHAWVNSLDSEKEDFAARYKSRFYKALVTEFFKEAGKTLIMAICVIPLMAIAIFGIVFPYDGRKIVSDLTQWYAPTRFTFWAAYPPCMPEKSFRDRELLHSFNKGNASNCHYRQETQKARIIHNYKPYFEAKKIDFNSLDYKQLRKIINEAKGR